MTWTLEHLDTIGQLAWRHTLYAGLPLLIGLVLAIPLGWGASRSPRWAPLVLGTSSLMFTIPSLALFTLMPVILGTKILDPANVMVAMTVYTLALLVRTVADGLGAVPDHVRQAATAMGYRRVRRLLGVELPLAVPVIGAGLRVAAVSNVSIVSVAALVGISQLGSLLTDGYQRQVTGELVAGILGCILLALLFDLVIVLAVRTLTPWARAQRGRA